MNALRVAAFCASVSGLTACAGESPPKPGEPFRVTYQPDPRSPYRDAQFVQGALPGYWPDAGPSTLTSDGAPEPPIVTIVQALQGVFLQGALNQALDVWVNQASSSLGLRLKDVGTGYWVVPAGLLDINTTPPAFHEGLGLNFASDIPAGFHDLELVAFDSAGNPGPLYTEEESPGKRILRPLCVASQVPDSYNSCQQTSKLPKAVISLSWDTNADLDLQVLTPQGVLVDSKNPFTVPEDGGITPEYAQTIGIIDHDSNGSCRIDGLRRENLVWATTMPHGHYEMYANMYSACGQTSARFLMEVYTEAPLPDGGGHYLKKWFSQGGELLDISANGGSARGLYVGFFDFI